MSDINSEIMVRDEDTSIEGRLTGKHSTFCSLVATSQAEKLQLFNVMNNPDKRVKDCINETIAMKDVFAEEVEIRDQNDGELKKLVRVVIIDDKGVSYQCVSIGVFSALQKLFLVFGMPSTWTAPVKVKVLQVSKGTRNMLTLAAVK